MSQNKNKEVYYLKHGKKYHLYDNCYYLRGKSFSKKYININNIKEKLCSKCNSKNQKENKLNYSNEKIKDQNDFIYLSNNNYNYQNFEGDYFNNNNINNKNSSTNNFNNNHIFNESNNYINNSKDNFNIINNNDDEEDEKINNIKDKKFPDSKDKFYDSLLNGSASISAEGGLSLNQKMYLTKSSSELDFNNNKFSPKNKSNSFSINNIDKISQYDLSYNLKNTNSLINKNDIIKGGQEDSKNKLKSKEEIKEKNKTNQKFEINKLNFKAIEQLNDTKTIFNLVDYQNLSTIRKNQESLKNISNQNITIKKNEFSDFTDRKINFINEDSSINISKEKEDNKNNIYNYNCDNNAKIYIINETNSSISSLLENNEKKLYNQKIKNLNKDDINDLKEANNNAKIISLDNSISNSINTTAFTNLENCKKEKYEETKNQNEVYKKGNYKFSFEINPKKKKNKYIKIEVGFEVYFFDENDTNSFNKDKEEEELEEEEGEEEEEDSESIINKDIILNSIIQKFCISRQFCIYKKTNKINVIINLDKGKFFVVGEKELKQDKKNIVKNKFNILYLIHFQKIKKENIRKVRPIFNYDKKKLYYADIVINGRKNKY